MASFIVFNVYMAHKLQCEQFMRLKAQNAQYVSSPSNKTVLQNLLVNISIESLEALRHEECLKGVPQPRRDKDKW